jgi:hypothetical protein
LAKKEMMCPFLSRLCKNCAIYIGRHYYLCFSANYRGNKDRKKSASNEAPGCDFNTNAKRPFEMPILKTGALDPFDTIL